MRLQSAIFDMDGTLVDSMGFWNRLGDEFLARRGFPPLSPELQEESIALTMEGTANLFIRAYHLPETPAEICAEVNGLMAEHYRSDVPLKPGAEAFLRQCAHGANLYCGAGMVLRTIFLF